jgi:hypothetical protein
MFKATTAALATLALLGMTGCCHSPGAGSLDFRAAAIDKVVAAPASFAGRRIEVQGTLANAGDNYFTDLRLELRDGSGGSIAVQGWLPLEAPPPRINNSARTRPAVLSDYLGKLVRLRGTWQQAKSGYQLQVEEGTIIEKGIQK